MFWRNVGSVLTGTIIAQAIPLIGTLILARQYTPDEFGIFAAWLSVALLVGVALTGRLEMALAIEQDGEPRRLAVLVTIATAIIAGAVVSFVLFVSYRLMPSMAEKMSLIMLNFLVPSALAIAITQTMQSWAAANGSYRRLTYMRVIQAVAITFFQITFGVIISSADGLVMGQLMGLLVGLMFSIHQMPLGVFPRNHLKHIMLSVWSKHRRFPALSLPSDTINAAAANLPVLLVASRYGVDIAGLLAMTMRILGAPIGILGKSVLDVFKRYASISYRERGECRGDFIRTLRVLAIGSVLFCSVLFFGSEEIFLIAFGDEWRMSGVIAIWMLPMFALKFIASPLSYMIYIAEKQHLDLIWQITLLALTVVTLSTPDNYKEAIVTYSLGYSILYVAYIVMSYRFSLGRSR